MNCQKLVLVFLPFVDLVGAASVAFDAGSPGNGAFEAEISPSLLSVHHQRGSDSRQRVARREAEPMELLRAGAASQDGAMPYFVGSWNGDRNNWYGDVGVSFVPQKDFTVVSLGRHRHNETGLVHNVPVTLWSVETKAPLAIVNIGPDSFREGHYHWEPVDAPGVTLSQGREYRLTQACTPNMADKWFDQTISYQEIEANAATGFARFVGGVNQSGFGFPEHTNGQFRRAGMVNFKMKPPPVHTPQDGGAPRTGVEMAVAALCLLAASVGAAQA